MTTDGIFNFFQSHAHIIQNIGSSIAEKLGKPDFATVRLLHDSMQPSPKLHGNMFPIHDDCYPKGTCPQYLLLRFYLTLDYIPDGQYVQFLADDKGRDDPARSSSDPKWASRFLPAPALDPGDVLLWDVKKLHSTVESERRVLTFSVQSGESPLTRGEGHGWIGMFDSKVWEKQDSDFYPIIYPAMPASVAKTREKMTGYPTIGNAYVYFRQVIVPSNVDFFMGTSLGSKALQAVVSVLDKILVES